MAETAKSNEMTAGAKKLAAVISVARQLANTLAQVAPQMPVGSKAATVITAANDIDNVLARILAEAEVDNG